MTRHATSTPTARLMRTTALTLAVTLTLTAAGASAQTAQVAQTAQADGPASTGFLTTESTAPAPAPDDQMALHGQAIGMIAGGLTSALETVTACRAGAGSSAVGTGDSRDRVVMGCNIEFLASGAELLGLLTAEYAALGDTVAATHARLGADLTAGRAQIQADIQSLDHDRARSQATLEALIDREVPPRSDPIARLHLRGDIEDYLSDQQMIDRRAQDIEDRRAALATLERNVAQIQLVEASYRFEGRRTDNARKQMEFEMTRYARMAEDQATTDGIRAGLEALPDISIIQTTFARFDAERETAAKATGRIFEVAPITSAVEVPGDDTLDALMQALRARAGQAVPGKGADTAEVTQ